MNSKLTIAALLLLTVGCFFVLTTLQTDTDAAKSNIYFDQTVSGSEKPSAGNVSSSYSEQVRQLKMYLSTHPEDTTHLLRLARLYHDGHKPHSAAVYYQKFLELKPNDRQTWLDLANSYAEAVQWQKALETTETMLDKFPNDGEGIYNLGAIHANMGDSEKAVETWKLLLNNNHEQTIRQMAEESIKRINTGS